MPITIALDLGTTTITALALDIDNAKIVARSTLPNDADITSPAYKARGWSQWDAAGIMTIARRALRSLTDSLAARLADVVAIGLTGQQHGVVLIDERNVPLSPFINWQDRRVEHVNPRTGETWLAEIRSRLGSASRDHTGCAMSPGYMGATLYWLKANGSLPNRVKACFLVDYVATSLSGAGPITDATSAASSGLFDVQRGAWHEPTIDVLGLPFQLFSETRSAGTVQGRLLDAEAETLGLPAGLPVCVGLGDNQASFYGSVSDLNETVLVNVGTGGQVAAYSETFVSRANLETRPFPGGYLLVKAGLCGGRSYALLESFFRQTCAEFGGGASAVPLFAMMNRLAAASPSSAGRLRCEPFFTGTRENPDLRGSLTGISVENFTPGHLCRALLEGMASTFQEGRREIEAALGNGRSRLVGAGNGLRENQVLAELVAAEFGLPVMRPRHREEAAFGAALLAAVGVGLLPDHNSVARLIHYEL